MQLLQMFWINQEALGEEFKETWIRLKPNYTVPFMSDIKIEENEQGDSDNNTIKVQVCSVGTLKTLF